MFGGYAPLPLRLTPHPEGWSAAAHAATARDALALHTCPFAACRFVAGTADSLTGFASKFGPGLQYQPTITTTGIGVGVVTFASSYKDQDDQRVLTNIVAAEVASGGGVGVLPSCATATVTSPITVEVRRTDLGDTPVTGPVFLTVQARIPAGERHRLGHYGGALDKVHCGTEKQPYAYWYNRQLQGARGSAIDPLHIFAHAENLAQARAFALLTRSAEQLNSNALARTASAGLQRFVRDYSLVVRPGESQQELRQRAAAFEEAPRRNDPAAIDQALSDLLGPLFVRTWWPDQSTALDTPPTPTFWPGVNPGPAAYDLGGGTWTSARAHVVVEVTGPRALDLRRYLELLNVELFQLLRVRLPATYTFDWATGISGPDGTAEGFLLDLSDMDFAGMA